MSFGPGMNGEDIDKVAKFLLTVIGFAALAGAAFGAVITWLSMR